MNMKDGGPAFPVPINCTLGETGMSLRDYFIAHAPAEPTFHFKVKMDRPRPSGEGKIDEILDWERDEKINRMKQWPGVWADAMLAEREKRP